MAPAVIVPEGSRKTVQHLEGGIVQAIRVSDGSHVRPGQVLVELDDTRARAEHAASFSEWQALTATEARLLAEQTSEDMPVFPPHLTDAAAGDAALASLLSTEAARFRTRKEALADGLAVLDKRIRQGQAEIAGYEQAIVSAERQLELVAEEFVSVKELFDKGLERKPRLLALQRAQAQIEGMRAQSVSAIAQARQAIAEAQRQKEAMLSERAEQVAGELAAVRRALATSGEKLRVAADRLERAVIRATVEGTVVDLRVKTIGGIIGPGEPVLDIVPQGDALVLEARVAPVDVDEVHGGLEARVHLLAYKSRNLPQIMGRVSAVSADRLTDEKTGQPYYRARISVAPGSLPDGVTMTAGMPAEVMIVTGERTALQYLLQPVRDLWRRGLNES
ncbi:MAG TPA: HlyD family type I secretion periplasmic adaptor subunit [Geminicoccus sp.]|jgi:HlyD family secretion protein/epimerase transport system membrane fusion protein|uniref:HlyD family type I secretion periplasmic adaptor subunit n=1 Tax=Geminicoccus sp. TaxID=2024832 RepID=UPI002E330F0E|nr:HlyD family type I secretion periplasmic adaptor subunit [Geminicoccus sp.]HEX2528004.1 HlyD family type I secretion periplasmic adaptor subunit [Geminicoccus sp.]